MNEVRLKRCTNCLMLETRPRITFDENGVCNACRWAEEKKKIQWEARWQQLENLCDSHRSSSGNFDCLVPVSGGKDSSYVAYMLKHKMGMNPLCVSIVPGLEFEVGRENLRNFINAGYDVVTINPNPDVAKKIGRRGLEEQGQPLMSWINSVQVGVFKTAINFNIPLIMFGEEGETEYGGSSKLRDTPFYDTEDSIKIYLSGVDPERYLNQFDAKQLYWWLYPTDEEVKKAGLKIAHWSYFENWNPYEHYLIAKEFCGMKEREDASVGTYNNFAQTDTCLFDLHTYFMYLKFGFGRCTQDVGIDIRRGALDRQQGIQLVRKFDGYFPEQYVDLYCGYYGMTRDEFFACIDKWANKDLFEKVDGVWKSRVIVE